MTPEVRRKEQRDWRRKLEVAEFPQAYSTFTPEAEKLLRDTPQGRRVAGVWRDFASHGGSITGLKHVREDCPFAIFLLLLKAELQAETILRLTRRFEGLPSPLREQAATRGCLLSISNIPPATS
jgi:diadenosine tetraphosphatase ApaH/serine/threonine PP2A family protein phosphatase